MFSVYSVGIEDDCTVSLVNCWNTNDKFSIVSRGAVGLSDSKNVSPGVYRVSISPYKCLYTFLRHQQYLPRPECSTDEKVKMKSNLSSVPLRYLLLKEDGVITVQLGKSLRRENSIKMLSV